MEKKRFQRIFASSSSFYLLIILILNVVIAIMNWRVAIPVFVLLIIPFIIILEI